MAKKQSWKFGVVGNIVGAHTDESGNVYYGTKAFTPGTKVYMYGRRWDKRNESILVLGINRFGRLVCEDVPVALIENVRTQRIYSPKILEFIEYNFAIDGMEWWERTAADRKDAEMFAKEFPNVERNN